MKAVYIKDFGGSENLEIREVDELPVPSEKNVLVRVRAAALNRADILQRRGLYPAPAGYPERIPGLEFAGEVIACGPDAESFENGDRVFGITAGGAQAEILTIHEDLLTGIPENLDYVSAAAVPEAFMTACDALFTQANLTGGESLLVHAVGSGVGLAALQLAKVKGAKVIGTSRAPGKLVRCAEFGLDAGLLVGDDSQFAIAVQGVTDGKGVDVVLDLVGGRYFPENIKSLKPKGRLMLVGLTGGAKSEIDLGATLAKRLTIKGTVLRSRSHDEKADITRRFEKEVVPHLRQGTLQANIDRCFKIDEIRSAHDYLESNESFGKVVLEI